jgi:hypothetical protein
LNRQWLYVSYFCYNTYVAKLTLSVDERVVSVAKRYAKQRGVSISAMVEAYLASVAAPSAQDAPVLRSVRGLLRGAELGDYKQHLERKYR